MINSDRNIVEAPVIKKNYRTKAIYKKLGVILKNKCFLCETKKEAAENFHIEHFNPHKGDSELKFDWNNLLLACGDTCNLYKSDKTELLDPCNPKHDVENLIEYEIIKDGFDIKLRFYAKEENNKKLKNTCNLLDKIHNGDQTKSEIKTASLRNAILKRTEALSRATINYYKAKHKKNSVEKQRAEKIIKDIISRDSPYTMLLRSIAVKDELNYLFD